MKKHIKSINIIIIASVFLPTLFCKKESYTACKNEENSNHLIKGSRVIGLPKERGEILGIAHDNGNNLFCSMRVVEESLEYFTLLVDGDTSKLPASIGKNSDYQITKFDENFNTIWAKYTQGEPEKILPIFSKNEQYDRSCLVITNSILSEYIQLFSKSGEILYKCSINPAGTTLRKYIKDAVQIITTSTNEISLLAIGGTYSPDSKKIICKIILNLVDGTLNVETINDTAFGSFWPQSISEDSLGSNYVVLARNSLSSKFFIFDQNIQKKSEFETFWANGKGLFINDFIAKSGRIICTTQFVDYVENDPNNNYQTTYYDKGAVLLYDLDGKSLFEKSFGGSPYSADVQFTDIIIHNNNVFLTGTMQYNCKKYDRCNACMQSFVGKYSLSDLTNFGFYLFSDDKVRFSVFQNIVLNKDFLYIEGWRDTQDNDNEWQPWLTKMNANDL